MITYLKSVAGYIIAGTLLVIYAFKRGKDSVENNENKEVAKNVQELNKIKQDVSRLSDDDLDKRVSPWKRKTK